MTNRSQMNTASEEKIEETFDNLYEGCEMDYTDALEETARQLNITFELVCTVINGGY